MKLKALESLMQSVDEFQSPKVCYEQYSTSVHISSRMLYTIDHTFDDLRYKCVADLGCGSGRLTIGSALIGAQYVLAIDCDWDAVQQMVENLEEFENITASVDPICADITDEDMWQPFHKRFDTCILNPPFGTKRNKGIDMIFLKRALQLSSNAVYSLHKTSTREHILRKAKEWSVEAQVLAELRFDLPKVYKFHKHSSVDIEVDFYRFQHKTPTLKSQQQLGL
ncbi:rRNA N6-adenosine-methyltransferase METTL5-like [Oppia nitens]|uniref:rRNA N6-adenosine-methyltransferase METTL5-like n=1 Tax=Oppia nitens TaxID=1686743 RepID=UPI0023DB7008|nr:rRNA N6-adenosine-methyltransferase METTL5-like [Oppia nitens]